VQQEELWTEPHLAHNKAVPIPNMGTEAFIRATANEQPAAVPAHRAHGDRPAPRVTGMGAITLKGMVATRLKDVAERADVSVKTVSNVVNGSVHVSRATRARVERAIAELAYRPNLSARSLRGAKSGVIALAVPELSEYFAELAYWLQRGVEEAGFTLLIDQTDGLATRERQVVEGIRTHLVDGLVYSPLALGAEEIASRRDKTPILLLGERTYGGPADHVAIDNVAASRDAVCHLIELGRTQIAAIGSQKSPRLWPGRLRLDGYRKALKEAGLKPDPGLAVHVPQWHRSDGAAATRQLLAAGGRPDAIFAFNDCLAIGALCALREAGVRVPDDIAVVGFDDIEEGRFANPKLTSIAPDKKQIARCAVDQLVSRIRGEADQPPRETIVPYCLVPRESTLGIPVSVSRTHG
jgi:DNA-binding LacI/PurR family transcriptional regulator